MPIEHLEQVPRLCKRPLEPIMETLNALLDSISIQYGANWSYAGGMARDLYLGKPYNDFDIVSDKPHVFMQELSKMKLYREEQPTREGVNGQDYFLDPYSNDRWHPIHFMHTNSPLGYAPATFDMSLNQVSLKSDGYFYAPAQTWKDLDSGLLRRMQEVVTTTLLMRAVRFSHKLNFRIHDDFVKEIEERILKEKLDTQYFYRQAGKMIADGVEKPCFEHLERLGVQEIKGFSSLQQWMTNTEAIDFEGFYEEEIRIAYGGVMRNPNPLAPGQTEAPTEPRLTIDDDDFLPF